MLVELMSELTAMYFSRLHSSAVYCGMGTTLDRLWVESGISAAMWQRLDALAYARACDEYNKTSL